MISSEIMYLQILNGRQLFKFEKPTTHFWKNYRKLLGTLKTTSCKQSAIRQTRIFHFNLLLIFFKSSICNCHNDEDSFFFWRGRMAMVRTERSISKSEGIEIGSTKWRKKWEGIVSAHELLRYIWKYIYM